MKSVEATKPVHRKQLLTYLLINFGAVLLKDGIHRVVNGFKE